MQYSAVALLTIMRQPQELNLHHRLDWRHGNQYDMLPLAYRDGLRTSTCVGRIKHFVKATVRSNTHAKALRKLGLATDEQRFAIVNLYETTSVQEGLHGVKVGNGGTWWANAVAQSMAEQRHYDMPGRFQQFRKLLDNVTRDALVLAVKRPHQDQQKRWYTAQVTARSKLDGEALREFAIPLSSNHEERYARPDAGQANWQVEPVVKIDRDLAKVEIKDATDKDVRVAIERIKKQQWYFVQTHSGSNSNTKWRHL